MVAPIDDLKSNTKPLILFPDISVSSKARPNPNMMLFLDVATSYTGYALIERSTLDPSTGLIAGYGIFKAPKASVLMRCKAITAKVSNIIHTIKPGQLIMEYPTVQGGEKGTAASRSGGILYLAYLCGKIDSCWDLYLAMVMADNRGPQLTNLLQLFTYAIPLTYAEWNGQTPKKTTCRRCEEFLGWNENTIDPNTIENNWVDAMMMGVWFCRKKALMRVRPNPEAERVDM